MTLKPLHSPIMHKTSILIANIAAEKPGAAAIFVGTLGC